MAPPIPPARPIVPPKIRFVFGDDPGLNIILETVARSPKKGEIDEVAPGEGDSVGLGQRLVR